MAAIEPMKAVVFSEYGAPSTAHLSVANVPKPQLLADEVLIQVKSVSLNPVDYKIVEGHLKTMVSYDLPHVLCMDVAGVVAAVGVDVRDFKKGDAVYSRVDHHNMGTLAEYCKTSALSLALKPTSLSFDESASIPLAGLTALQSMRDVGSLKAGQSILILGASGGVGTLAIQIAKILGASNIIVTCSAANAPLCSSLGATQCIDYKTQDYTKEVKDVDLLFDTTGDVNNGIQCVKKGGHAVSVIAGYTAQGLRRAGMEVSTVLAAGLAAMSAPTLAIAALHSVTFDFVWMKPDGSELREFNTWIGEGKLKPVVDRVFNGFDEAKQAFAYLAEGHAKGKVVLHLQD